MKTDAARALRPVGAVAENLAVPADALHSYRVRFPAGSASGELSRLISIGHLRYVPFRRRSDA